MKTTRNLITTIVTAGSLLAILYGAEASQSPAPAAAAKNSELFAVRDVRLFDGTAFTAKATVVVDHGIIKAVGPDATIPANATIIDGNGKTLLPGLIDAHTHTFLNALTRALRFGVTTELDMFTSAQALQQWHREEAAGPVYDRADIRSAGTLVTVKGGHGTEYFPIATFTPGADAQAYVDARIAEGSDYIKLVIEDGSAFGTVIPTLNVNDVRALVVAAHARGKLAVVHVSTLAAAREAIGAGADGLAHLFTGASDPQFAAFVAAHHAFVIPTMTVMESTLGVKTGAELVADKRLRPYMTDDEAGSLTRSFPQREGRSGSMVSANATVAALRAAHVPILAGTDAPNPGTAHGISIHRELAMLVDAGLTPAEALAAATSVPARIFKLSDRGRIAPGLRADLLLVDGDLSNDIHNTRAIAAIWKNGRRVERGVERVQPAAQASAPLSLEGGIISDFEAGKPASSLGGGWTVSTDQIMGGQSTATLRVADGGAHGSAHALEIAGEMKQGYAFPWAGAIVTLGAKPMQPADLSHYRQLTFFVKGTPKVTVLLFAKSHGAMPSSTVANAGMSWTKVTIPFATLDTDGKDVQAIFIGGESGSFTFAIDDVRVE